MNEKELEILKIQLTIALQALKDIATHSKEAPDDKWIYPMPLPEMPSHARKALLEIKKIKPS